MVVVVVIGGEFLMASVNEQRRQANDARGDDNGCNNDG